ncbi:MAG: hypothetical protein JJE25_08505, partial [Bacteroidia bacterium]|nr:hypothetical protein [Bacteroidia bacterium]
MKTNVQVIALPLRTILIKNSQQNWKTFPDYLMKVLFNYLKRYRWLALLTLILAAINQVFSLLDPWIFRIVIDKYATHTGDYTRNEFMRGAGLLLLAAMGVAFISRVAKNFQDYYVNVITQRLGAQIY